MRTMPPWQANEWFALPVETSKGISIGVANPLCLADNNRVVLIFSVVPTNTANVGISLNPITNANSGNLLNTANSPIILTHSEHGPLAAQQWFGVAQGAGQSITVTELMLRDYPQPDPDDTGDVADQVAYLAQLVKALAARMPERVAQYA